ncbi:Hypothetical_protein [Hexamita inflata]|uniref:Hypothetical_protein n=1 Tax=Hexamita inflata TaxID=28002 RepID=A0AA86TKX4_9EUKA|nr:Hypothetical protein HINF_LOCUS7996 [Hexamita inflata]
MNNNMFSMYSSRKPIWVIAQTSGESLKISRYFSAITYYIKMGVISRVQRLLSLQGSWVNHTHSGKGGVIVFKLEMSRPRPLVRLVMQNSSQKEESESLAA